MWEIAFKFAFYIAAGLGLILTTAWYIRSLSDTIRGGGNIVIADFTIVGRDDPGKNLGSSLALMLQARLVEVLKDWDQSVTELTQARADKKVEKQKGDEEEPTGPARRLVSPAGGVTGISSTVYVEPIGLAKKADLPSFVRQEVFTATVSVSGVDVSGAVAWMQRRLANTRTLRFAFYEEKGYVQVTGDLSPAGIDSSLRVRVDKEGEEERVALDRVVETLAYEIARRWMARDRSSEIGALAEKDFPILAQSFSDAARFNRLADLGGETKDDFEGLLPKAGSLARQASRSYVLNSFAASVARGAGHLDTELGFQETLKKILEQQTPTKKEKGDYDVRMANLDTRIQSLRQAIQTAESTAETATIVRAGPDDIVAQKRIEDDMLYATQQLNKLFSVEVALPILKLLPIDERNAYWTPSENTYYAPPPVQYLPDVTYHALSFPYFGRSGIDINDTSQALGEILASFSDILAMVIKQRKLGQDAKTADWVLAPGSVAWIAGKDPRKDTRPLRSIKAPGTAFAGDPVLGNDSTVDHLSKYDPQDFGRYRNAGILSKAFYEVAIRIENKKAQSGTERAAQIWIAALSKFAKSQDKSFQEFARTLLQVAGDEQIQVREALESVGFQTATVPASAN